MLGRGLLKGMRVTLKSFFNKKETLQYPEKKLPMPARFRGGELDLDTKKCIACGLCSMACPNHVIELTTGTNEAKKRYLKSYVYHSGLCLYCNFCVEACPTNAICWDKNYENSRYFRDELDVDCLAIAEKKSANLAGDVAQIEKSNDGQADTLKGRDDG